MKTITFSSWKGGTGKTTLGVAAITTLAKQGKKILIIDLDSNLSMTQCFNRKDCGANSVDLLNGSGSYPQESPIENIDIIPSDLRISRMTNISDRVLKVNLKKLFEVIPHKYDYIFIDPPGTMNALTRNAICASDKIVIPAMPSEIDFEATGLVFDELEMMGVEADVSIVLNGFDLKRNRTDSVNKFFSQYDEFMYEHPISAMKSLKNLTGDVFNYSLVGRAKEIIDNFVMEVIL